MVVIFSQFNRKIEVAPVISTLSDMTCMDEVRGKEPAPKG
jgi:hypothetical protein